MTFHASQPRFTRHEFGKHSGVSRRPGTVLAIVLVALLTGACATTLGPLPTGQIYVSDIHNNRIVRVNDMTGGAGPHSVPSARVSTSSTALPGSSSGKVPKAPRASGVTARPRHGS